MLNTGGWLSAGLWVLSLCNSLFSSTVSDIYGSLGLPRLSALSFPLQDLYTLAPPPCVEIWGSELGQSEGSLCHFPFSQWSLSFATWYPISLKLFFHIFAYFAFGRGVVLSKKVNLVLVTLTWMEMEVCWFFFFFHLATDFIVWIFATVFLYTNFNFLQNSIFHIATSFSILCHISIRNYFPKSQSAWLCVVVIQSLSCVRPFVTPWTVARQAPLSMGFPKQEYWSGFPFPSPYALSFDDPKFIKIVLYCMICLRKFSLPQRS